MGRVGQQHGWSTRTLGDLYSFRNGMNAERSRYGGGIRFANVFEIITQPFLRASQIPGRVNAERHEVEAFGVQRGDVLFNRSSETADEAGLASVYCDDEPVLFGGFVIRATPNATCDLSAEFAGYALRSRAVRAQISSRAQGAIRANVGQAELATVEVTLPPLEEQRAIAAALNDVDALIAALDALIAKKRDIKQATMQQLLTGKTRLPGFSGAWETLPLGQAGLWMSGGTPSKARLEFWNGSIPWVSAKDMKAARLWDSEDHVSPEAIGRGTRQVQRGAILVVVRGMILAHSVPVAMAMTALCFNQDLKALVVESPIHGEFVFWWLVANERLLLDVTSLSSHGTKRIPMESLKLVPLPLPPLAEQRAIAEVLTDLDAELAALDARREKTRLIKQGMMQALLTGQVRLV